MKPGKLPYLLSGAQGTLVRFRDRLRVDGLDADLVNLLDVQHEVALLLEDLAALHALQRLALYRDLRHLPLLLDGHGGVALLGEVNGLRLREEVAEVVHVHRRELGGRGRRRGFQGIILGLCYR